MPRMLAILLAWGACAAVSSPVYAQRGDVRFGPWISAGIATGAARIDCPPCPDGRKTGVTGSLAAGGTPSERVSLGVEGTAWRALESDSTREFLSLMAVVYYYPSADRGLFVRVGAGGGRYAEESPDQSLSSNGFVLQFTLGHEIRIRRTLWIVPYGYYLFAPGHSAKRNQFGLADRLQLSMLHLGAAVTWRRL